MEVEAHLNGVSRIQGVNGKLNNRRENAKVILFMIDSIIVYAAKFAL